MIGVVSQNGHGTLVVPVHTKINPADIITLDIETANPEKNLVDEQIERWEPASNIKDEEKAREKFANKCNEKGALLDCSPIACVGIKTNKLLLEFNGMDSKPYKLTDGDVVSCGNEAKMLIALRGELNKISSEETALNGFNILGFDLPKLRIAYVRHRLLLPEVLKPRVHPDERKQPIIDTMLLFLKYFTSDQKGKPMISLKEVAHRFGLPDYKDLIDGSMIPDLIEKGEIKKVLNYNSVDVICEEKLLKLAINESREMR